MTHELEKLQRKGTVRTCPRCKATVLSTSQPDDSLLRCAHGNCLRDGSGELLEPPCGCRAALAATPAADYTTSQPERMGIKPEALTALKGYTQADEDGVMVNVSRQALDEAIAALAAAPDRYTVDDPWSRPVTPSGTQGALALYLNEVQPVDGRVQLINISLDELSVLKTLIQSHDYPIDHSGHASTSRVRRAVDNSAQPAQAAAGGEREALEKIIQRLSGPSSAQLWDIRQIAEGALAAAPAVGGEVRDIENYVQHHQDCDVFDKLKRTCTCGLSEVLAAQPASPLRGNVCCYCDAPLSCARCGMEQPDDTASPLRGIVIQDLHVEYIASKGLSRLSGWIKRSEADLVSETGATLMLSASPPEQPASKDQDSSTLMPPRTET